MQDVLPVFIGYDGREHDAYEACRSSLLRTASCPIFLQRLSEPLLRHAMFYRRDWTMHDGVRIDALDGKPFSTAFSFSRFLVPALMQYQGWGVFVDCDFLFKADIASILPKLDPQYAVMCCKQNYIPKTAVKMDGQVQQAYNRKNWSSFMAFNCAHPANQRLTPFIVNRMSGSWLHGFSWLEHDGQIGDLDHRWNWIDGTTQGEPLAVHYTLGVPSMAGHENQPYADDWRAELRRIGL